MNYNYNYNYNYYKTERQVHQLTVKKSKRKKRDKSCKSHV